MLQIFLNYLTIFIIPGLIGLILRLLFFKSKKGWIVSAVFAIITVITAILTLIIQSNGSETLGLLIISSLTATVVSVVCGLIKSIIKKNKEGK